ncbi:hypothetical protein [Demequina sp. NBRC 110057]|uniref:hypothetical protein n=1 Tax=Demequina sp. NBRC 110057 TaxID=1570346 RepID=UPI000A05A953|nr:hypothetical protein [Demequina sp. NBRC 110057]
MSTRGDDGSWSRAYMASSGLAFGSGRREESPELHLASGADLPRARVAELSKHRDVAVREAVARRLDCPFGVLAALAHDTRPLVRIAVASHPRAGRTVLEHLAGDRDPHVLKAVARNEHTPLDIVKGLEGHRREEVRHIARRMLAERAAAIVEGTTVSADAPFARGGGAAPALHAAAAVPAVMPGEQGPERRHAPRTLAPRPSVGRRRPA